MKIIGDVGESLAHLNGPNKKFKTKYDEVFNKNRGFQTLKVIAQALYDEEDIPLPDELQIYTLNDLHLFKNAPTTSVDVERTFSEYKAVLASNRRSFIFENLKHHMIIKCNKL